MKLPTVLSRRVLIMWLTGLTGLVIGAFGGWALGVVWADATPDDPSRPFADIGTVFGSALLGLVLVPLLFVFLALRFGKAPRPLVSAFLFLVSSAVILGILVRLGTLLLPVNIGVEGGAIVVALIATFGGALITGRLIR